VERNQERLWRRAQRAFGERTPAEAIATTRAIIGPGVIPNSEIAAQRAMEKLKNGDSPTSEELVALEFVIRIMRPAPLSHGGLLDALDAAGGNLYPSSTVEQWDKFRAAVQQGLASVGRIDHPALGQIGTGFLVRDDVLATNRHVLDHLTGGTGVLLPELGAIARFRCEYGEQEPPETKAQLLRAMKPHPTLDIAFFEIDASANRKPLLLDSVTRVEDGHPIAVIGFPSEGSGANPLFADAIFSGKYGVKRGSLGEVMDPADPLLFHDCSTLGGNSGSPVFSLVSHQVIGIHRSGWFTYRNEALAIKEFQNRF